MAKQRHYYIVVFQLINYGMMILLCTLNFFWFYKILAGVHRVMTKGMKEATSGTRDAELTEQKPLIKEGPGETVKNK